MAIRSCAAKSAIPLLITFMAKLLFGGGSTEDDFFHDTLQPMTGRPAMGHEEHKTYMVPLDLQTHIGLLWGWQDDAYLERMAHSQVPEMWLI